MESFESFTLIYQLAIYFFLLSFKQYLFLKVSVLITESIVNLTI